MTVEQAEKQLAIEQLKKAKEIINSTDFDDKNIIGKLLDVRGLYQQVIAHKKKYMDSQGENSNTFPPSKEGGFSATKPVLPDLKEAKGR